MHFTYPATAPEIAIPELDGTTVKCTGQFEAGHFYKSVKTQLYPVNVSTDSPSLCPAYAAQRWKDLPDGSLKTTLANCFSSEHCYIIYILLLPTPPLLHISS